MYNLKQRFNPYNYTKVFRYGYYIKQKRQKEYDLKKQIEQLLKGLIEIRAEYSLILTKLYTKNPYLFKNFVRICVL